MNHYYVVSRLLTTTPRSFSLFTVNFVFSMFSYRRDNAEGVINFSMRCVAVLCLLYHSFTRGSRSILLPRGSAHGTDARGLSNVREIVHVNSIQAEFGHISPRDGSGFTINDVDNAGRSWITKKKSKRE